MATPTPTFPLSGSPWTPQTFSPRPASLIPAPQNNMFITGQLPANPQNLVPPPSQNPWISGFNFEKNPYGPTLEERNQFNGPAYTLADVLKNAIKTGGSPVVPTKARPTSPKSKTPVATDPAAPPTSPPGQTTPQVPVINPTDWLKANQVPSLLPVPGVSRSTVQQVNGIQHIQPPDLSKLPAQAAALARQDIASQVGSLQAQQQFYINQAAQRAAAIMAASRAGANILGSMAPDIFNSYQQAGQDLAGIAHGYSGQLAGLASAGAQNVQNELARIGLGGAPTTTTGGFNTATAPNAGANALYALTGAIPGSNLIDQAATNYAAARAAPGSILGEGQQAGQLALGAGNTQAQNLSGQIANVEAKLPSLTQSYLSSLSTQAQRAFSNQLSAGKYGLSVGKFGLSVDKANQAAVTQANNEALSKARVNIQGRSLDLRVVNAEQLGQYRNALLSQATTRNAISWWKATHKSAASSVSAASLKLRVKKFIQTTAEKIAGGYTVTDQSTGVSHVVGTSKQVTQNGVSTTVPIPGTATDMISAISQLMTQTGIKDPNQAVALIGSLRPDWLQAYQQDLANQQQQQSLSASGVTGNVGG